MTIFSSVNSLHASEASKPVQVSRITLRHKSSPAGKGGWSAAKNSVCLPLLQELEGSVPEMEQITVLTIPSGRVKSFSAPPEIIGVACCINCDQIGAAPLKPVV